MSDVEPDFQIRQSDKEYFMTLIAIPAILFAAAFASTPPPDTLSAGARLAESDQIAKGAKNRLVVESKVKSDWDGSAAAIPNVIVQVKAPPSVKLLGDRETDVRKLSKAEFLRLPDERLTSDGETAFPFEFVGEPKPNERFEINLLAYVTNPKESDVWFVRKRIALPLAAGATSNAIDAGDSSWGVDDELQLGDPAPTMTLPRLDGDPLDLEKYIGKKNVVITTYRAHW
jgi:hypothetical protein